MFIFDNKETENTILFTDKEGLQRIDFLSAKEISFLSEQFALGIKTQYLLTEKGLCIVNISGEEVVSNEQLEKTRILGANANKLANELKIKSAGYKTSFSTDEHVNIAFLEGFYLANYQFIRYKTQQVEKTRNSFEALHFNVSQKTPAMVELEHLCLSVYITRDFVNEPLSYLTAEQYASDMTLVCEKEGISVTTFHKDKIEALGMGGVLGVNKGSKLPPTFNILEYKSTNATNEQPIVLVGKGVVYDTGGLSLKPTTNSMDFMKSDMAGSAAVIGVLLALAKNEIPLHVIGLVPCVENRPGEDAIVPGDILTMYDKTTVEVLNTDAEGRLILADALAYAKQYNPALVMDFATLTGAAAMAVGAEGMVFMGTASEETKLQVKKSGDFVCERLVEFPLWPEYNEYLESKIADIKNIGGPSAGAITAGKFLEKFTSYPWLHFDIAGAAYLHKPIHYKGIHGTGVGVRLIYNFLKSFR
ncbi:MAG: leucyl aminopeptidase [Chitinophagales bacterium]|nr:leucyl aminopeptidase [Chitinophagales bacterium]